MFFNVVKIVGLIISDVHVTGEVKYSRNGQAIVSLMFVDMTLPLWGLFDIYGSVQTIKLAGG